VTTAHCAATRRPTFLRKTASLVHELLEAQLARLREVPLDLMQHAGTREATRADAIAVAIEHLQAAIDALELASQP
jgi:hypothetical protein